MNLSSITPYAIGQASPLIAAPFAEGSGASSAFHALLESCLTRMTRQDDGAGTDNSLLPLLCAFLYTGAGSGVSSRGMSYALQAYAGVLQSRPSGSAGQAGAPAAGWTGTDGIPAAAGRAVNPPLTNGEGQRSAAAYRAVIDQFDVENNPRYAVNKKGRGDTYCNIFVWDVTRAMGAEIPHYVDPDTLEPRYYPDIRGARELSANGVADWLERVGARYGWRRVSAEEAQALANRGHPVVTAHHNPGGSGHVQVVCPSADGRYDPSRGVTVAQAGRRLMNYGYITQIFGRGLSEVVYYAHG